MASWSSGRVGGGRRRSATGWSWNRQLSLERAVEFERRVLDGDPLSEEEMRELFEILRGLKRDAERQRRLLEKAERRKWVDWLMGAATGLLLTLLAHALGLPV